MYKFIIVTYRLCISLSLWLTVYVLVYHCDFPSMYKFIIVTYRLCISAPERYLAECFALAPVSGAWDECRIRETSVL